MPSKKLKAPAAASAAVPQTQDECAQAIKALGDFQRKQARLHAEMNDRLAEVTAYYQAPLTDYQKAITAAHAGIQTWCEANRVALCGEADRRGKTANLVTGTVSWRRRPPSVSLRGVEAVIQNLLDSGLGRFVRQVLEVNKDAILAEPAAVAAVPGIKVVSDLEDFIVTPFEADATAAEVTP